MSAPSTYAIGTRYGVPGKMWAAGHHTGVDFLSPTGGSVKAPVASTIIWAGRGGPWGAAYGINVVGECKVAGKTYRWIVAHLQGENVSIGDKVVRGKVVGKSDSTGNVTGPHTHFEVRVAPFTYGHDVNPNVLIAVTGNASTDRTDPAAYFLGAHGDHVTWLGERLDLHLKALGLASPYVQGPGPNFTVTDREAVAVFQRAMGWSGAGADGYPGVATLKALAGEPSTAPPIKKTMLVSTAYINGAAYDTHARSGFPKGRGISTKSARIRPMAARLTVGSPLFIPMVELSADMLKQMDAALPDYHRQSAGGKGRELYVRKGQGVKVIGQHLRNVQPTLKGDDKPFLSVAWTKDGFRGLEVIFHNENEGTSVQLAQMVHVLTQAIKDADTYRIPYANILVTGDGNLKEINGLLPKYRWKDAAMDAKKKTAPGYHSTNDWSKSTVGRRIDIFAIRSTAEQPESFGQELSPIISDHNLQRLTRVLVQ